MGLGDILEGHTRELLGLDKDISEVRLDICKSCPLRKITLLGPICNSKLWYNPVTRDRSSVKKDGYVNGCGCRLNAKTRLSAAECPLGKW